MSEASSENVALVTVMFAVRDRPPRKHATEAIVHPRHLEGLPLSLVDRSAHHGADQEAWHRADAARGAKRRSRSLVDPGYELRYGQPMGSRGSVAVTANNQTDSTRGSLPLESRRVSVPSESRQCGQAGYLCTPVVNGTPGGGSGSPRHLKPSDTHLTSS